VNKTGAASEAHARIDLPVAATALSHQRGNAR